MLNPSNEPTAWGGALTALAVAIIPFLRAFNVNISEQQGDAVMTLVAAFIVVGTVYVRSKVTPVAKAESAVSTALNTAPASIDTTQQSKEILAAAKS